ncbi:MAG TPA: primosomal protein N', partial [Acinetobacter lwoffii]|nr:primosomal protein N' [Acinetobacter lwoffii]
MQNSHTDSNPIYRVRVAVSVHVFDCFDYTMSAEQFEQAQIGTRVLVSFGRQNLVGVIIEKLSADTPLDPRFKLKAVTELLDERAIIDSKVLSLLTWSAQYYQFPIGEVIHSALPTLLRQGKPYN